MGQTLRQSILQSAQILNNLFPYFPIQIMSFSPKQFRESLQQSTKVAQRFEKYLGECRASNTYQALYCMVEEFLRIFTDKESLLLKVNSLYALTLCLETCEYAIVQLAEAFLLPTLQEAALYHSDKRTYAKTAQFFREKGYPASTPSIDQLSHNFVNMATDLVFLGAAVKPHYYFFTDRLNIPSAYKQLATRLIQKGNEAPPRISEQSGQLLQLYQNNLYEFENHEADYVEFFKKRVSRLLLQGGRGRQALDIRKLLRNNDSWLTSEIIGSLSDALQEENFTVRRHALGLLNELFIWGDVEAIMIVNEGQAVERVYQRILEVKGSSDLGRGAQIYPEIKGQLDQKKAFYVDFLRCLETWSKLIPTAIYLNRDEDSKIAKLHTALREKGFLFPSNDLLLKQSKQFQQNMRRNQQRNDYIIAQLNDGDTSKNRSVASHRLSKYSQKISLIKEMRESTILSLPEIQKLVQEAQAALRNLPKVERDLTKNMKTLRYFMQEFQKKFCLLQQSVSESRLESLYDRGCRCTQKIAETDPYYQDYLQGRIDFRRFGELVTQKMSQINHNKSKSRFSDVLSKLSKSKHSQGDLSRSLHTAKALARQDHVLQRSNADDSQSQFSRTLNNLTKTNNNPSVLSQKDSHSRLSKQPSKHSVQHNKQSHISNKHQSPLLPQTAQPEAPASNKLQKSNSKVESRSHKNSISFERQESVRSSEKERSPATAKFLLDQREKDQPHESMISRGSSKRQKGSQSSRANAYNKNTPSYPQASEKKRQQFSDNSEWSSSDQEKQKEKEKPPSKPPQKPTPASSSGMHSSTTKQKLGQSKSREVFSDSSFSQYQGSNEQLRQAIDKSENPDFKMLFGQKSQDRHSQNSKLSRGSKLHSQDHYVAVLQSLAAKSQQNNEKSLSKLSKEQSASQLPPRSNYDQGGSKIDQRNYVADRQDSSSSGSLLNAPAVHVKTASRQSDSHSGRGSHGGVGFGGQESNSMYPPEQEKPSIVKPDQPLLSPPPSSLKEYHRPPKNPSKISSDGSEHPSSLSRARSSQNFRKGTSRVSEQSVSRIDQHPIQAYTRNSHKGSGFQPSPNDVQSLKQQKLQQIHQLQKRIKFLKSQQKHLHVLRSQWSSPTRPPTLRTALSPRFRNQNTTSSSNNTHQTTRTDSSAGLSHPQRQRPQEMNFDVAELFKPPEGRLVYSRLYRKQLAQIDIRQRRKVLKGKELVFRNDDVEVGLMIHRDANDLKIIYYVTPSRFLKTFIYKLEHNTKLAVHAIPNELSNLEPRKQYRVYLFAEVLEFPYKLPLLMFKYHPDLLPMEEKLFVTNSLNNFHSLVPFFFTKFLTMRPIGAQLLQQSFATQNNLLRGQQTPYSRKLLPKHFYILQYFPDMVNLHTTEYQSWYGVECEYGSTRFILKVVLKINKFMYIQGVLTAFRDKTNSEKIVEYTICCINHLLSKTHPVNGP